MTLVATSKLNDYYDFTEESMADLIDEIHHALGDIEGLEVWGNMVLLAMFVRPAQTRSGFVVSNSMPLEDAYQGKVGLIVKLGPDAFPEGENTFNGRKPAVGDWVYHNPQSFEIQAQVVGRGAKRKMLKGEKEDHPTEARSWNGWAVRLVRDSQIHGRLEHPEILL